MLKKINEGTFSEIFSVSKPETNENLCAKKVKWGSVDTSKQVFTQAVKEAAVLRYINDKF